MREKSYRKVLIFMLLLLLFTMSYQASHPVKAAENDDFKIVDGKLVKYYGSDKNVIIPEGITCIGDNSEEYYSLGSVFDESATVNGVKYTCSVFVYY